MFRHFSRLYSYRNLLKRPSRSASVLTVGVSTTLVYVSSLALVGRTVKCDNNIQDVDAEGGGGGGEEEEEEEKARRAFPDRFHRPRWRNEDYYSADHMFSQGPIWFPASQAGIARCDALIVTSNPESEDAIAVYFPDSPGDADADPRAYIGLFDGHNGPAMSDFLCDNLIDFLSRTLTKLPLQYEYSTFLEMGDYSSSSSDSDVVSDAIKRVFKEVDDALLDVKDVLASPSRTNAVRTLRHAYSGSCALVSVYEPDTRVLRVALTGDSRAVLGRKVFDSEGKDTGKYEVHVLSQDQNGRNASEVARLNAEHPGETLVSNGRVLGWGISRAFGDAAYKWSLDVQKKLYETYLGDRPRPEVKTPPYFTAEPEISTTIIQQGDFLIMASDGLWDILTNEEAVGLISIWLTKNSGAVYTDNPRRDMVKVRNTNESKGKDGKVYLPRELPVAVDVKAMGEEDHTTMYRYWHAQKKFVNKDDNAASHLTRNALGGADSDLTEALLSLTPPRSRRYRDDIGVVVTFFA